VLGSWNCFFFFHFSFWLLVFNAQAIHLHSKIQKPSMGAFLVICFYSLSWRLGSFDTCSNFRFAVCLCQQVWKKKRSSGLAYRLSASVFLLIQKHNNPTIPLQKKSNYVLDLCVRLVGMLTYRFFLCFEILFSFNSAWQLWCNHSSRFSVPPDSWFESSSFRRRIANLGCFTLLSFCYQICPHGLSRNVLLITPCSSCLPDG
jgi:hypothetical protein